MFEGKNRVVAAIVLAGLTVMYALYYDKSGRLGFISQRIGHSALEIISGILILAVIIYPLLSILLILFTRSIKTRRQNVRPK